MISLTEDNRMLGYESLGSYSNIFHFVTTRHGGNSTDAYSSFNCSPFSGDKVENVIKNQELLFEDISYNSSCLVIPHQTHGCEIAIIDEAFSKMNQVERDTELEGIDALITQLPNYCISISTADCVPILLYDKKNKAIAAIHAGWRGTIQNIALLTLQKMQKRYGTNGQDVVACIGPSISKESFEVGEEVYKIFADQGYNMNQISWFNNQTRKYHIDLWEANKSQLLSFGIPTTQIETSGICTYKNHADFFSARRLGIASGRILSGIMLTL